jgi:KRAB domain-containing zinc finger protein
VRPFNCDICDQTFKTKSSLKVHSAVHSSEYNLCCSKCGAKFKAKQYLAKHVKFVHSNGQPFQFNDCEKSYKTKGSLQKHIKVLHLCQ